MLLRSDGRAVDCLPNGSRPCVPLCQIPPLEEGVTYTQVSTGGRHLVVLLRSDGRAVACGHDATGQLHIPPLDEGLMYTEVSTGAGHKVLLRSDGRAVACGRNSWGQCNIPPLEAGVTYTQVSAGGDHTVLLRSDGRVVACGSNRSGQLNIPSLASWRDWLWFPSLRYISDSKASGTKQDRILQVSFLQEGDLVAQWCPFSPLSFVLGSLIQQSTPRRVITLIRILLLGYPKP